MILVIDNYDSFTYNLVQLLLTLGAEVEVRRNDVESVDELLSHGATGIVLSPGPGRPESAGVCLELLESRPQVPILGVCLGHQSLGMAFGGVVERAAELMHGKTSEIAHGGDGIFTDLPDPFIATRYHSLCLNPDSLPDCFDVLAHSEDGTIMGIAHRDLPYWGVQFHPESVLTEVGGVLVNNFLATI